MIGVQWKFVYSSVTSYVPEIASDHTEKLYIPCGVQLHEYNMGCGDPKSLYLFCFRCFVNNISSLMGATFAKRNLVELC